MKRFFLIIKSNVLIQVNLYIVKNQRNVICNFNFYNNKESYITLIGNFHINKLYPDSYPLFNLYHNKKIIDSKSDIHYEFKKKLLLKPGVHNFNVTITNNNNKLCSCPSYLNGYVNTKYLYAWTNEKKHFNIRNNFHNKNINKLQNLKNRYNLIIDYLIKPVL